MATSDGILNASPLTSIQDARMSCWPSTWTPNQTVYYTPPAESYANEVEVVEGEHDATLTFWRRRGTGKSQVYTLTVPKALLAQLAPKKAK